MYLALYPSYCTTTRRTSELACSVLVSSLVRRGAMARRTTTLYSEERRRRGLERRETFFGLVILVIKESVGPTKHWGETIYRNGCCHATHRTSPKIMQPRSWGCRLTEFATAMRSKSIKTHRALSPPLRPGSSLQKQLCVGSLFGGT